MAALNSLLTAAERALLLSGGSDVFRILNGKLVGQKFKARLVVVSANDVQALIGDDARMVSTLSILPQNFESVNQIEEGVLVQKTNGVKYKLTKRENNDDSVTIDFQVEQQI
jgi:hypothetical protein